MRKKVVRKRERESGRQETIVSVGSTLSVYGFVWNCLPVFNQTLCFQTNIGIQQQHQQQRQKQQQEQRQNGLKP